ncbi:MAG: radical SAM family heme chaperone HemW [Elusimicrobia bacterium]|nr:radical SAM family heme chaperone HemW [Elusimicrobiota bacterium]
MLGLYIHIPFCRKKCNYCDFVSQVAEDEQILEYLEAIKIEMNKYFNFQISTIYLGGGTPSILSKDQIKELFLNVKNIFDIKNLKEITVEANPESLRKDKLEAFKNAGVNRLSMGLQSFDNKELKYLGRVHSIEDFKNCYKIARDTGFKNISLDLIYGLPNQTKKVWENNLKKAVQFNPEHISLYPLIIETGTLLHNIEAKVDEDLQAEVYEWSMDFLKKCGYEQYEISNWAKPGFESKHNLNYWHNGEYLGIGVSAASHYKNRRYKNTEDIVLYMQNMKSGKDVFEEYEEISYEKKLSEEIILNLRCSQGFLESNEINIKYGDIIDDLLKNNLIEKNKESVYLTRKGKLLANQVMMRFV